MTGRKGFNMLNFWIDYPSIEQRLKTVCSIIEERVTVRNKEIQDVLVDFTYSGGKMLRPALFFLFADLGEPIDERNDQLTKIAASLEILHMATLIHDDIIDDSPLRRGRITVQAKYGKDIAVYTGDLLFTQFFELLIESMNGSHFLATNAQAMKRLLLGELDQMHTRYNIDESIADYLQSINGKTAELFWLACIEGTHFGGLDLENQERAGEIGRNIGIAFQVFDDILDYTADSGTLKKPVLEDLAQGVYTLPLLFAKEQNPAAFESYLSKKSELTTEEATEVAELVRRYHGVEKATDFAVSYTEKALADIELLPNTPSKEKIRELTQLLLQRNY